MKKVHLILIGVSTGLVIVGIAGFFIWQAYFKSASQVPEEPRSSGCDNLDISNWQTYDKQGFSVKYPSDWTYKDDYNEEQENNTSRLKWYVSFGPSEDTSIVWIGGSPTNLDEFKNEITSVLNPGFDIEGEENATVDAKQGTKLTVQGRAASYKSYLYHIPFLNIPYIFQGPALESSNQFEKCEPQVFQEMLKTFKFPQMPGPEEGGEQNLGNPTVEKIGEVKRYEYPWKFQFSTEMDASTVKADNLNLYAVGLSLGSQGTKSLSNETLKRWTYSYDKNTKILTITVSDREDLVCASCSWELEFTDKIKDKSGNSLTKKTFEI